MKKEQVALKLDEKLSGSTEWTASSMAKLAGAEKYALEAANYRLKATTFKALEIVFKAIKIFGFSEMAYQIGFNDHSIPIVAILGLIGEATSYLAMNDALNHCGAVQNVVMTRVIGEMSPYLKYVNNYLTTEGGLTSDQVQHLSELPAQLYGTQFGTTRKTDLARWLNPIACGIALAAANDALVGGAIALTGLAAIPLGDWLYARTIAVIQRKMVIGAHAKNADYRLRLYHNEHIPNSQKNNALSVLPTLIQAAMITIGKQNLLPRLTAVVSALTESYFNLLPLLKSRFTNEQTAHAATTVVEAFLQNNILIDQNNLQNHARTHGTKAIDVPTNFSGLSLQDFSPTLPGESRLEIQPLTLNLPAGTPLVITGKSGSGKSRLFSALAHITEHAGQAALVRRGQQTNIHELCLKPNARQELDNHIIVATTESFSPTDQLIDAFKAAFNARYPRPTFTTPDEESDWNVATTISNKQLEKELELLSKVSTHQTGLIRMRVKSIFKSEMLTRELLNYYHERENYVAEQLLDVGEGSNLSSTRITPLTVVAQLSDGEKRRLSVLSVLTLAKEKKNTVSIILFDEPLAGLDAETNGIQTIEQIANLQANFPNVNILIIDHGNTHALISQLNAAHLNLNESTFYPNLINYQPSSLKDQNILTDRDAEDVIIKTFGIKPEMMAQTSLFWQHIHSRPEYQAVLNEIVGHFASRKIQLNPILLNSLVDGYYEWLATYLSEVRELSFEQTLWLNESVRRFVEFSHIITTGTNTYKELSNDTIQIYAGPIISFILNLLKNSSPKMPLVKSSEPGGHDGVAVFPFLIYPPSKQTSPWQIVTNQLYSS